MNILISTEKCMICGKPLSKEDDRVKGHLIPKMLKPKDNVLTYFHKECEEKINSLYVCMQKKPPTKKIINVLENTMIALSNKIEELKDE